MVGKGIALFAQRVQLATTLGNQPETWVINLLFLLAINPVSGMLP
jgi:hypothetical protein